MSFEIFYNVRDLLGRADEIVGGVDAVSFDLFDTLVVRRVFNPDMIKPAVARYIFARAAALGIRASWYKILIRRAKIEKAHRKRNGQTHPDQEARYPEFIAELLREVFGAHYTPALLEDVTAYELSVEKAVIVPREGLMEWVKKIYAQGKKIYILSDIYLPSPHLKELIKAAGLAPYVEDVYSSADDCKAKASASAFPVVEARHKLQRSRWLHIGDNPISDGLRPSELGIRSLVLRDAAEKQRKAVACRYHLFTCRPFWRGRAVQQLMMPLEAENGERDPLYIEGYNFLGPLIGYFVQRIGERCRELNIDRLYFMSREGWTFQKCWEKATPRLFPVGKLPRSSYLYGSRMALAPAACAVQGLTTRNAAIALLPPGNRDFRDVCRVFGLDVTPLRPFLARHDLTEESPLSMLYSETTAAIRGRFFDLLDEDEEFQDEVRRQTRPVNEALQKYLEQEGFFEQRDVAMVDVGWLGTIQRFLYEAVAHRKDCPRVHGFVLGASRGIRFPTRPDNYIEGLLFDRDRFNFAGSVILYNRDLFEEACRAPHAGLRAYAMEDGKPKLVFRHTDDESGRAELAQSEHFAPLQKGVFDAAERYGDAVAIMGYKADELGSWLNGLLVSKIAFPRTREVAVMRQNHHLDDFHGTHVPPARIRRAQVHLWDRSLAALRFNPLLRLKYYLLQAWISLRQ